MPAVLPRQLRIGIDCRLAGRQHAGIGRYVQNLVFRLPKLTKQVTWVLFFFDNTQLKMCCEEENLTLEDGQILEYPNVECRFAPIRHYTLSEQLRLPFIFRRANLDLLHVPHFNISLGYNGPVIVTIHDLLWHEYQGTQVTTLPAWEYRLKHRVYRWVVGQAARRAAKIIVPTETIRLTVGRYYPSVAKKIEVTREGVDRDIWHPPTKKSAANEHNKQLVYVGSLYPHKNIRVVIDALAQLPGYQLIIVGTRNAFQEDVRRYVELKRLSKQVTFAGYLSDQELLKVFHQSIALVQPSFSEGFGLTGIEAMAAGLPVIASNIPVFQEIYGKGAQYFDPSSTASFVKVFKALEHKDTTQLVRSSQQIAKLYDWDEMAKQTWQVYQEVVGKVTE